MVNAGSIWARCVAQPWQSAPVTSSSSLGRLSVVPPRQVWPHEALNFTPWLLGNVDVLSDLLGMDLTLEVAEHPVGDFSLDLMGRDETDGRVVIVENQLERSDHTHLGQILTYAAGTDPTTIVWVAAGFRPEHREAIDWLNARTDENTRFFAVEIEVVRIGQSEPAPNFRLVAQPNDWAKTVKAATSTAPGDISERERLYYEFWARFRDRVIETHPTWTKSTGSTKSSWFGMSAGIAGINWISTLSTTRIAVQLIFEQSDRLTNTANFEALLAQKDEVEGAFGALLSWEPREGEKSTRISVQGPPCDVAEREKWDEWIEWLIASGERLRTAVDAAGGMPSAR